MNSKWSAAVRAIDAAVTPTTAKVNWGLTALPDFADACDGGRIAVPAGLFSAARINQEIIAPDERWTPAERRQLAHCAPLSTSRPPTCRRARRADTGSSS